MNLDNLTSFLTAAELKSMAKASEKLHLTHPALSKQIRKLETYYGTELLTRNSSGVQLTAAGKGLIQPTASCSC
ncbi:LysR family transcriptional regulator [Paenibacillus hexagrammi]|uniref:LysR family transcriptional regulator n=1 Tax=Paenibacillus hexagrammi TaxID=2908839 RepID=A0ABY3SDN5_9BACL|nr:LysR family transcriptional regulator [Paenibacillus sp. YPD9-1]UJF31306.1 LysR family transcriptional regulator [Paenibacillus sp. YPD9-1]